MSGVSVAGGFVVFEPITEEEQTLHGQWMRRHFPHLRTDEPSREERLADLAEPLGAGEDAAYLDRRLRRYIPGSAT